MAPKQDQDVIKDANKTDIEAGAFDIDCDEETGKIRLVVKDMPGPIPEEQREIANGVYHALGVLKQLRDQTLLDPWEDDDSAYAEFRDRLCQVARAGLTLEHVETRQAMEALQQIREEVSTRLGRTIKFRYLRNLAAWAAGGIIVGLIIAGLAQQGFAGLAGYGWVIVGSMIGAWVSVAATRRTIVFEEMPNFLDSKIEPFVRLLFVGFLAATFTLFIDLEVIQLTMAGVNFLTFDTDIRVALLLGVIAGISEKAVSLRVIDRAQKVISPPST